MARDRSCNQCGLATDEGSFINLDDYRRDDLLGMCLGPTHRIVDYYAVHSIQ
jgi:hypothetical protein